VDQHDGSVAFSVNISEDYASVLGRKRHGLLRGSLPRKQQRNNYGNEPAHAANVPLPRAMFEIVSPTALDSASRLLDLA
jgi:hypothetical protein